MEFKSYSFKDLLENIVDNRGKTCPVEETGIPLIATNCIKDDTLYPQYERVRYVSDETYNTWFRGHPEPEDIIFVCKGSPGRVAWAQNPVPYCIAQDMVAIRANRNLIHPKFLFALLRSPRTQKNILNMHVGTMIPHFKKGDFSNLYFDIPVNLDYQKWAGELYFDFCNKIELNKQTNQTLEQMAQTLFKSWFVDFDPVFDNLLAKADFKLDNLASDFPEVLLKRAQERLLALDDKAQTALLSANLSSEVKSSEKKSQEEASQTNIHKHFPSGFEHNDQLGWIPKGWATGALSSVTKYTSSRMNGAELTIDNYVSTENMLASKCGVTQASSVPTVKTIPSFIPGHILISNIRPYFKKIWLATSSGGRSNDVLGFESLDSKCQGYLMNLLYQDKFFDYMMTTSKGSKMPRGDKQAIMDWPLVIPPITLREYYSDVVKEYYEVIPVKVKEIETLTKLRDTLLPKLISGEITINKDVA